MATGLLRDGRSSVSSTFSRHGGGIARVGGGKYRSEMMVASINQLAFVLGWASCVSDGPFLHTLNQSIDISEGEDNDQESSSIRSCQ